MKIDVIIDNQAPNQQVGPRLLRKVGDRLAAEHGLSFHFSLDGKHYLVDTGASGAFIENMEILSGDGVCNVEEIDAVFISHGHNDHTGGLRKFFEHNSKAPVYLHNSIRGNYFYSCRPKNVVREARNIGMEQALFADYGYRFTEIGETTSITEKITLIPLSGRRDFPTPMGNEFLYCNDLPDNFTHEVAVLVEYAPEEFAVISPCSHNGILNILEDCREWIGKGCIKHFIGGLHYVDYLLMGQGEKEAASILETASIIKEKYPHLKIHTGHCTCTRAAQLLADALGEQCSIFCSGCTISLL
ncbi:MAG: MBL fold metallo-hydrolase [Bacteroidales bacterium]|nr:MBL fold metallo-hydrolase [Bacteroidales bacterium]